MYISNDRMIFVEMLAAVMLDWDDILSAIQVVAIKDRLGEKENHWVYTKDINFTRQPQLEYFGCKILDLQKYFDIKGIKPDKILFYFKKDERFAVTVKIFDAKKTVSRSLKSNFFDFDGPLLELNDLMSPVYKVKWE